MQLSEWKGCMAELGGLILTHALWEEHGLLSIPGF